GDATNQRTPGLMMFVPVWFWFAQSSPLRFYGVIEEIGVEYIAFSTQQVPRTATFTISARQLPKKSFSTGMPSIDPRVSQSPSAVDYRDAQKKQAEIWRQDLQRFTGQK